MTISGTPIAITRALSKLHALPWTADPDRFTDPEGLTLQARLAEDAVAILRRAQQDALGDSYDEDTDGLWQAVMDGTRHGPSAWPGSGPTATWPNESYVPPASPPGMVPRRV